MNYPSIEECSKFRKKTSEELAIDDCNANPREDENCKCLEEKPLTFESAGYSCFEIQWDADHYWKESCEIELQQELIRKECTSSRPKTECEKGNPDWVEV